MHSLQRPGRPALKHRRPTAEPEPVDRELEAPVEGDHDLHDTFETYRVVCPDCRQPIALLADEETLPEHALCASPWNPFGLTVCAGTGRDAAEARPADESYAPREGETARVLTLPQGLDWRTQPFSHVGGPGSRPMRRPLLGGRAA
ncbi:MULTISPECIES: hypothetical protein [unclassified Streptomyces]|uniref:hypothetical protein n=1 Tax=unclassified Streptomyces TaxID=2593676 RepID=UPI001907686B|nr:hypothetical protein [Streptomyces sp. HSG2]